MKSSGSFKSPTLLRYVGRPVRKPFAEPWQAWIALLVGVLAVTAQTASSITVSVLMKSILADFGWSRSEFATAATVRILAMVAAMPLAGRLTDRVGARAVLSGGAVLVGLCVLALASVRSLPQLLAINVMMGPGQACIGSVAASTLVLRLFRHHRGLAVGILNGGDNLLNAALPLVATGLALEIGWRGTLANLGGTYFALALLTLVALRATDGREEDPRSTAPSAPASARTIDPRVVVVFLVFAAIYAFITSLQLHFHAFQTDSGRSPEAASRLLSIQILVGALGAPLFGALAEWTSARTALVVCATGLAISAGLVWNVDTLPALTAWAVFHGLVNSGVVALLALVLHEVSGGMHAIGRRLGAIMSVCMGATVLGNQWSAWTFDHAHSYLPAWQVYTGLMVAAAAGTIWLRQAR